jgi:hypothetical protein
VLWSNPANQKPSAWIVPGPWFSSWCAHHVPLLSHARRHGFPNAPNGALAWHRRPGRNDNAVTSLLLSGLLQNRIVAKMISTEHPDRPTSR